MPNKTILESLALEKKLIAESTKSEEAKRKLKEHLRPMVVGIAELYSDRTTSREELIPVAWLYFDYALDRFKSKYMSRNSSYHFGVYFSWYAKLGIESYLIQPDYVA
jgi:hypothetical protein